jgi:hypothetical protein
LGRQFRVAAALRGVNVAVVLTNNNLASAARAAHQAFSAVRANASVEANGLAGMVSYPIATPIGEVWLNLRFWWPPVFNGDPTPQVRLGRAPVPKWLTKRALEYLFDRTTDGQHDLSELVKTGQLTGPHYLVTLNTPQTLDFRRQAQRTLLPEAAHLAHYGWVLRQTQGRIGLFRPAILELYVNDLFAAVSSQPNSAPVKTEAAAAFVALGLFLQDHRLRRLTADRAKTAWTCRPQDPDIRLAGRQDLAQHFAVSAAIAVLGSGEIGRLAGELKELTDSLSGGSGFSFADMAANRAGLRLALASQQDGAVQTNVVVGLAGVRPGALLPFEALAGQQEGMNAGAFEARFGTLQSGRYAQAITQIDAQIDAASALYAETPKPRFEAETEPGL